MKFVAKAQFFNSIEGVSSLSTIEISLNSGFATSTAKWKFLHLLVRPQQWPGC